jgi:hypothetical protein
LFHSSDVGLDLAPRRRRRAETPPDLAPPGTPLQIAVAPGVLDQTLSVIREPDDTDESYRRQCELLTVLLDYAAEQD